MIRALAITWLLAAPALAQEAPDFIAKRAAGQLEAAQNALLLADRATDRVQALTKTVKAYEHGLVALREGLRRAAIRETALRRKFEAERERLAQLLGVLASIETSPGPLLLLHPSGPLGTARSGMIVSDVTPALQAEVATLRAELEELALMRALQQSAAQTLQDGLAGAQQARVTLSQAMSNRVDLPTRHLEDPQALSNLVNSVDTLRGFAAGIAEMRIAGAEAPLHIGEARGALPLPVAGTVLRRAGEADAAGIERPGLIVATEPRALVTTPWSATIRYRGPLLDYGNVMVLEPGDGYLLVLAGLEEVYGDTGDVLPAGSPVGLMGGNVPGAELFLTQAANGGGGAKSETLYIELRQGEEPVDPGIWFAFDG
ncbi:Peptidase, M23/M37 family [Candidatus Rhodobacter oscarellae]|uniref:Peptidase, M23/M37 family n=1 Tax=Candidatus Rhodobacter oscarellae TaxID=1675527 RepID=A0A0J9EG59_9RHOB|nr:peptidoglycan DD-metalloendopeptidase family protein [Candidatus Rhodobacter lobularis]KMW60649.1 Peptidase, M23/M37 family [Candidatus Rhodobacter lobularis]